MDAWLLELQEPTPDFLACYARRARAEGINAVLRELAERLPMNGPSTFQSAQGLMLLRAILVLSPWLQETSLHGLLAAQALGLAMGPLPEGVPPAAGPETYASLRARVAPDMASTGIKGILAHQLEDLAGRLGLGAHLLPLLQATCAAIPTDTNWYQRALKRLEGPLPPGSPKDPVRVLCEGGLVEVLDHFGGLVRRKEPVLGFLVEGAARKLLEAGRELQGRTSWLFVYLATLPGSAQAQWLQAAALVNFFPSEDWASLESEEGEADIQALQEAMLDAEPDETRRIALALLAREDPLDLMPVLAEAVASSDPMNDGGHRLLAAAAVAELLPLVDRRAQAWMVLSLAHALAATQTSGDRVGIARRIWEHTT